MLDLTSIWIYKIVSLRNKPIPIMPQSTIMSCAVIQTACHQKAYTSLQVPTIPPRSASPLTNPVSEQTSTDNILLQGDP